MPNLTNIAHLLAEAHEKYGTTEGRSMLENAMRLFDEVTAG